MKIINKIINEVKEVQDLLDLIKLGSKEMTESMQINGFILDKFQDEGLHVRSASTKDN